LRLTYGEEFMVWAEAYLGNGLPYAIPSAKLYKEFLDSSGLSEKDYTQNRFSRSLKSVSGAFGMAVEVSTIGNQRHYSFKNVS